MWGLPPPPLSLVCVCTCVCVSAREGIRTLGRPPPRLRRVRRPDRASPPVGGAGRRLPSFFFFFRRCAICVRARRDYCAASGVGAWRSVVVRLSRLRLSWLWLGFPRPLWRGLLCASDILTTALMRPRHDGSPGLRVVALAPADLQVVDPGGVVGTAHCSTYPVSRRTSAGVRRPAYRSAILAQFAP